MDSVGFATVLGTAFTILVGIVSVARWLIKLSQEEGRRRQRLDYMESRMAGLPCEDHSRRIATLEGAGKARRK